MERPTETLPYAGRASAEVYAAEQDEVREKAWQALGDLYARRRLIIGVCAVVSVVAVVITLLLPNIYRAETRVLQPEGGDLGLSGILQSVAPGAASLLGGDTGSFTRYLAILDARTMMDTVVDEFDLLTVYEIEPDDEEARSKAIRELRKNVTFEVSLEYDYMGIQVLDKSPERAAAVANFFVDELNRRHVDLSSSSARQNREFIESRVLEAEGDLDSALVELQRFQEENGVLELDVQVEAFLRSVADVQAQ
ncbi:MAG: Wzz/FepE/Etk N-terminal domain-containing protein, partial [Bacteroidota bacterium]